MYILFLLLAAFLLISLFSTNWPVKIYHHLLIKKLAGVLETVPERYGLLFSNVYSQINTIYQGKRLIIRFMEASADSLKANSGLELRLDISTPLIMEFYRFKYKKHEWGDFKRFLTGDPALDSQWFILTDNPTAAGVFWNSFNSGDFLAIPSIEQILINRDELIIRLGNFGSTEKIKMLIDRLVQITF